MSSELWDVIKSLQSRISELETVLDNLISFGKVAEVDYQKGLVAIDDGAGIKSSLAPWVGNKTQGASEWNPPEVGQPAMMLSAKNQSFMLMGGFSDDTPAHENKATVTRKDWSDGSFMSYDRSSNSAVLNLGKNANITITATDWAGDVNITGNVSIDGLLLVTKNTSIGQNLTVGGGIAFGGGAARSTAILRGIGDIDLKGSITSTGDQKAGSISQINHTHTGDNGGNTSKPK